MTAELEQTDASSSSRRWIAQRRRITRDGILTMVRHGRLFGAKPKVYVQIKEVEHVVEEGKTYHRLQISDRKCYMGALLARGCQLGGLRVNDIVEIRMYFVTVVDNQYHALISNMEIGIRNCTAFHGDAVELRPDLWDVIRDIDNQNDSETDDEDEGEYAVVARQAVVEGKDVCGAVKMGEDATVLAGKLEHEDEISAGSIEVQATKTEEGK